MYYVAIDIGNVSVTIDQGALEAKLETTISSPEQFSALKEQFECGKIAKEQFLTGLAALFPGKNFIAAQLEEAYDAILGTPLPGMENLLDALPKYKVQPVFFSDISELHLQGFQRRFRNADKIPGIYSFQVGAWKKSEEMYKAFEEKYGKPELYVDDRQDLIEDATARGWPCQQFVCAREITKKLIAIATSKRLRGLF